VLQEKLRDLLGEYTFEEAYAQSGIAINVAVSAADTSEPPRLLNYLTAPNVLVWSAVACSSAFPFLYAPQTLLARDSKGRIIPFANKAAGESQRRWRDGSLEEDLPMRGLSEMFNVNYFLVSQCNPYLLPILAAKEALPRTLGVLAEQEFKHRCQQLMELMPRKLGASKFLKLLSQPWEGDVTMVLPVTTLSAVKAVINLSKDDVLLALSEGQKATWKQLSSIAANCNIEVTLDECLRQVTAKASRKRVQQAQWRSSQNNLASRRGIPSWIHLQSLGIPNADSFEGLLGASHHHQAPQHRIMGSSVPEDLTLMDEVDSIELDEEQKDVEITGKSPVGQRDVWKALFEVAPASNALDFIAP
jgi:TAG lipase/steryl ester hydrolase/phospholipase A2/LPA acyltransferase